MKSILISIQPKWVEKILNKRKTVEVRKGTALYKAIYRLIEQYGEATLYVYCTKDKKDYLYGDKCKPIETFWCQNIKGNGIVPLLNGKVVAMFTCKKVEDIVCNCLENGVGLDTYYMTDELECDELEVRSWLSGSELRNYLGIGKYIPSGIVGTAIHIDNLVIFDKPKGLNEFGVKCGPQSYRFIEVE